ncbi:hypothetical protein Tco_1273915 [Tanacetum coccineum]
MGKQKHHSGSSTLDHLSAISIDREQFVQWISDYELPDDLVMPKNVGTYKDLGDPESHGWTFDGIIKTCGWNDPIACRMFQETLTDSALSWFKDQANNSITGKAPTNLRRLNRAFQQRNHEDPKPRRLADDRQALGTPNLGKHPNLGYKKTQIPFDNDEPNTHLITVSSRGLLTSKVISDTTPTDAYTSWVGLMKAIFKTTFKRGKANKSKGYTKAERAAEVQHPEAQDLNFTLVEKARSLPFKQLAHHRGRKVRILPFKAFQNNKYGTNPRARDHKEDKLMMEARHSYETNSIYLRREAMKTRKEESRRILGIFSKVSICRVDVHLSQVAKQMREEKCLIFDRVIVFAHLKSSSIKLRGVPGTVSSDSPCRIESSRKNKTIQAAEKHFTC